MPRNEDGPPEQIPDGILIDLFALFAVLGMTAHGHYGESAAASAYTIARYAIKERQKKPEPGQ